MAAPGRKKGPSPRPARPSSARPRPAAPAGATPARTRPAPSVPPVADAGQPAGTGLGTTGLVLGVLAVVASPTLTLGVLLGVPALVVGFLALQRVRRGQASNRRSSIAAMVLGGVAVAVVIGLVVYGRVLLSSPAGKRYTACLDRAGDDAARQVCEDTWDRER